MWTCRGNRHSIQEPFHSRHCPDIYRLCRPNAYRNSKSQDVFGVQGFFAFFFYFDTKRMGKVASLLRGSYCCENFVKELRRWRVSGGFDWNMVGEECYLHQEKELLYFFGLKTLSHLSIICICLDASLLLLTIITSPRNRYFS